MGLPAGSTEMTKDQFMSFVSGEAWIKNNFAELWNIVSPEGKPVTLDMY